MKKIITTFSLCLALAAGPVLAHHPAADIVDQEIYEMIDSMVAETPHADLVFDEEMGNTTITADSVSAAEDLIDDGLLATLSLLDEGVTVTITFGEDVETKSSSAEESVKDGWTEMNDWGVEVFFTVDTILKE
ncbi:MAG: hypothetical protein ABFS09_11155 [Thermodesulfobacteriota bacterium]